MASARNTLNSIVEPAENLIQAAVEEARRGLLENEVIPQERIRELNRKQKELFDDEVEVKLETIDDKDLENIDDPRLLHFLIAADGIMLNGKPTS